MIKKFYKETKGKIKIIGQGSRPGESAFEKITAGADAETIYRYGLQGPGIVKELKDLISILKKENLKNVSEAVELTLDPNVYKNYITPGKIMSKRCELTGISPLKGHNVSHAKIKLKEDFYLI